MNRLLEVADELVDAGQARLIPRRTDSHGATADPLSDSLSTGISHNRDVRTTLWVSWRRVAARIKEFALESSKPSGWANGPDGDLMLRMVESLAKSSFPDGDLLADLHWGAIPHMTPPVSPVRSTLAAALYRGADPLPDLYTLDTKHVERAFPADDRDGYLAWRTGNPVIPAGRMESPLAQFFAVELETLCSGGRRPKVETGGDDAVSDDHGYPEWLQASA